MLNDVLEAAIPAAFGALVLFGIGALMYGIKTWLRLKGWGIPFMIVLALGGLVVWFTTWVGWMEM